MINIKLTCLVSVNWQFYYICNGYFRRNEKHWTATSLGFHEGLEIWQKYATRTLKNSFTWSWLQYDDKSCTTFCQTCLENPDIASKSSQLYKETDPFKVDPIKSHEKKTTNTYIAWLGVLVSMVWLCRDKIKFTSCRGFGKRPRNTYIAWLEGVHVTVWR